MSKATRTTASTCCYCGVGCGVLIEHDGDRISGVRGDPAHPANYGKLCSKGATLHLTIDLSARGLYPALRLGKALARTRTDWDSALDHAASVFAATIAEHGPDSVAFYIAGQLLTCVVVETDGNGDPVPQDAPEPKRGRHGKFPDGLCGLAVRWCEDPDFFRWLRAEFPNIAKNTLPPSAAVLLKSVCGISSRKELDADTPGRATFIKYIKEPYAASRKGRGLDE